MTSRSASLLSGRTSRQDQIRFSDSDIVTQSSTDSLTMVGSIRSTNTDLLCSRQLIGCLQWKINSSNLAVVEPKDGLWSVLIDICHGPHFLAHSFPQTDFRFCSFDGSSVVVIPCKFENTTNNRLTKYRTNQNEINNCRINLVHAVGLCRGTATHRQRVYSSANDIQIDDGAYSEATTPPRKCGWSDLRQRSCTFRKPLTHAHGKHNDSGSHCVFSFYFSASIVQLVATLHPKLLPELLQMLHT